MSPALLFTLTLDHCACLSTAIPFIAHLYLLTMNAFMTSTFTITGTVLLVNVIFRRLQTSGREKLVACLDRYAIIGYWPAYFRSMLVALPQSEVHCTTKNGDRSCRRD